jgi:hypothetical protein
LLHFLSMFGSMSKLKYKKHILHAVFMFIGVGGLHAQQTVPASGGDAVGSGGSSSYTVGQVVYTTNTGANGSVAQGIQQPYEISTLVGLEVTEINLEHTAYPNPTNNVIHLSIGNYENEKLSYQLYDIQGRLLVGKPVKENLTSIVLQDFSGSSYLLNVLDNNQLIKTFRIIKTNK